MRHISCKILQRKRWWNYLYEIKKIGYEIVDGIDWEKMSREKSELLQ